MNRFYLANDSWQGDTLTLEGDEAKHCSRVMRTREGDLIEIFDGLGKSARCTVLSVDRDRIKTNINDQTHEPPAQFPVTLCQSIPKGSNMELIIQKAVELGVNAIQPLITDHTVARPEALPKKQEKWQRIALEACKQCGQNYLPEVKQPQHFKAWIEKSEGFDTSIIASLDPEAVHLKTHLEKAPFSGSIGLLIGPEGDFSHAEYQQAYQQGFHPISFGNIIMRVETASIYGLSLIQYELTFA